MSALSKEEQIGKNTYIVSLIFILILFAIGISPYTDKNNTLRLIQAVAKGCCIIVYTIVTIKHFSTLWAKRITRASLLFIFFILVYCPFSTDPKLAFAPLYVLLSFPFFYCASHNNIVSRQQITLFLFIGLIVAANNTIQYYYKFNSMSLEEVYERNFTNNNSYTIAMLLPYFFLIKRKTYHWLIIIPAFILILIAQKRGAILTSSIFLLSYLYISLRNSSNALRSFSVIATITLIYIVFNGSTYFFHRFADGSTSGRSEMYPFYISHWMNGSFLRLLFGNGLYATMDLSFKGRHLYAHSDFVEAIYDFGLVGLLIYLALIISILKFSFKNKHKLQETSMYINITMLIFIVKGSISGVYLDIEGSLLFILLGILLGSSSAKLKHNTFKALKK